jgi:hypothetical protein
MSTHRTPSASSRERIADHVLRSYVAPRPTLETLAETLRTAKGMAASLGVIAGSDAHADADPADLAALAWAVVDHLQTALILVDDLDQVEDTAAPTETGRAAP